MNLHFESIYQFNRLGETPVNNSYENMRQAINLVQEEVKEAVEANRDENHVALLDAICDILVTATGLAYRMGLTRQQLELALTTVDEANLSKFCSDEREAIESVAAYEDDPRYTNVTYKKVDDKWTVFGKVVETGCYKILKSINTVKPEKQLAEILDK
jgi:predicted HAD superfamily Cof-like phosphohydrolase